jgi:hypothetical protein
MAADILVLDIAAVFMRLEKMISKRCINAILGPAPAD